MDKKCVNTIKEIRKVGVCCLYESTKHFFASKRKFFWFLFFSLPVIVINILISSEAFVDGFEKIKTLTPILSLMAATLASVSGFLKLQGNSESHENVGNQFRELKGEIDIFLSKFKDGFIEEKNVLKKIDELRTRYNAIVTMGQNLRTNDQDYRKAQKSISDGEKEHTDYELKL